MADKNVRPTKDSCYSHRMLDRLLTAATFAGAIGSGLIAGVFFAFSTFVMRALSRQPAPAAVAA